MVFETSISLGGPFYQSSGNDGASKECGNWKKIFLFGKIVPLNLQGVGVRANPPIN